MHGPYDYMVTQVFHTYYISLDILVNILITMYVREIILLTFSAPNILKCSAYTVTNVAYGAERLKSKGTPTI